MKLGIQKHGVGAKKQKVTKATVASVAESLTKTERTVIQTVFINKSKLKKVAKKTVESLCSKGILRSDTDLLTNTPIFVLERGGRMLCDFIKRGNRPVEAAPVRVRVEIERHAFMQTPGSSDCLTCHRPFGHNIHLKQGTYLCAGIVPDSGNCFTVVNSKGSVCPSCAKKLDLWRKAELVLQSTACPHCGGVKRIKFSVDQKCYHELPEPLQHGLFKQHGEPEVAYRERYPLALAAALDFLHNKPTQAEINERAKVVNKLRRRKC